jgi:hypothetical protein
MLQQELEIMYPSDGSIQLRPKQHDQYDLATTINMEMEEICSSKSD